MKNYLIGLLIVLAAGVALLLIFNQRLFTAADEVIELKDDVVEVIDNSGEPVEEEDADAEEEMVVDVIDEEASGEVSEPVGGEGNSAADGEGFTITNSPFQDFIRAREKGEPIVFEFYAGT